MADTSWVPIGLSAGGAIVSFLTMVCVAVIGWLVKYVLANTERRILQLEAKADSHATHIASATTQTQSEQRTLNELREDIGDMREKFEALSSQIATLIGGNRSHTPPRPMPKPDARAERGTP